MNHLRYDHTRSVSILSALLRAVPQAVARWFPQWLAGHSRVFKSERTRRVVAYVLLVLGMVLQGVMILVACYLIDLALALMDLWALLARKYLELTL